MACVVVPLKKLYVGVPPEAVTVKEPVVAPAQPILIWFVSVRLTADGYVRVPRMAPDALHPFWSVTVTLAPLLQRPVVVKVVCPLLQRKV